jgi:thiol-disulfide isomerase/thioredoxin
MTELTLYMRNYCHLCHDMHAALLSLASDYPEYPFDVRCVDIDAEPDLEERYGEVIPVLAHGSRELARIRLDMPALMSYLRSLGPQA